MSLVIDESKKTVILEGLGVIASRFVNVFTEIDESDFRVIEDYVLIATIQPVDEYIRLVWCDAVITQECRMRLAYSNNLDSIAQYTSNTPVITISHIVFAVLECVRKGINAKEVFLVKSRNMQTSVYMVIDRNRKGKS